MEIVRADTDEQIDAVRELCWEYRDFLLALGGRATEIIQHYYGEEKYSALMDQLLEEHAHPGRVLLMLKDGMPIGCGMFYPLDETSAEIKRVYIRPEARGLGAGRQIMDALIAQCRANGFKRILMDTGKKHDAAIALYDKMGFKRRGPYQPVPDWVQPEMIFFEMDLL